MKRIKTLFSALYRPKVILWIGIVIIVLMCLFPPFITDSKISSNYDDRDGRHKRGYTYLFSNEIPTCNRKDYRYYDDWRRSAFVPAHIDFVRLIIQCGIIGLITGGLLYSLKDKKAEGSGK